MSNHNNPSPSTVIIVTFSAFLASFAFAATQIAVKSMDLPPNQLFSVITGVGSIIFCCGFTIFVLRKRDVRVGFGKLFITSLLSVIVMSVFVALFYTLYFRWIDQTSTNYSYAKEVFIIFNAFGMIFSSLLAIIFKKE
jgi:hypothetical protein